MTSTSRSWLSDSRNHDSQMDSNHLSPCLATSLGVLDYTHPQTLIPSLCSFILHLVLVPDYTHPWFALIPGFHSVLVPYYEMGLYADLSPAIMELFHFPDISVVLHTEWVCIFLKPGFYPNPLMSFSPKIWASGFLNLFSNRNTNDMTTSQSWGKKIRLFGHHWGWWTEAQKTRCAAHTVVSQS